MGWQAEAPSFEGSTALFQTTKPVWDVRMKDQGIQTMTGFYSDMPEHIDFLRGTISDITDIYPGDDVESDGTVGRSGVHEPVGRYKTVTGFSMKPMSYTAIDNKRLRAEKGLPNNWRRNRDRELFEALCHLFMKEIKLKNIKTNRVSTSGFPEFQPDYEWKIGAIDHILRPGNPEKVLSAVVQHDLPRLLADHKLVLAYAVNKRRQEDLADKKRFSMDYEYAISGGTRGQRILADKKVVLANGSVVEGFSAQRIRPVKGSPIRMTAMLQPFAAGIRASISEVYAFTYKHTTDEDSAEKLNRYGHLTSTDYTEFDSTYPGFMRESMLKVMAFYFDPAIVELARLSFSAPYFQPSVYAVPANATAADIARLEASDPGRWVGNPLDVRDFIFNSGIVSGNPFVDIEGKLGGTFDALCKWDHILGDMDKRMVSWLKGEDSLIANRNQGDDNQALTSDPLLKIRFDEVTLAKDKDENYIYSYFAADMEKGQVFTGKITTHYDERGFKNEKMRVIPRAGGFLRWFTHERGIDSKTREFWPIGFFERLSLYGQNPAFGDFWRITNENWTRATGTSLETIASKAWKPETMGHINVKSVADLEVLLDHEKLAYLYTEDDQVSPEIRNLFEGTANFKQVESYVTRYYRGHIH